MKTMIPPFHADGHPPPSFLRRFGEGHESGPNLPSRARFGPGRPDAFLEDAGWGHLAAVVRGHDVAQQASEANASCRLELTRHLKPGWILTAALEAMGGSVRFPVLLAALFCTTMQVRPHCTGRESVAQAPIPAQQTARFRHNRDKHYMAMTGRAGGAGLCRFPLLPESRPRSVSGAPGVASPSPTLPRRAPIPTTSSPMCRGQCYRKVFDGCVGM